MTAPGAHRGRGVRCRGRTGVERGLIPREVGTAIAALDESARGHAGDLAKAENAKALHDFTRSSGEIDFLIKTVGVVTVQDLLNFPRMTARKCQCHS